MSSAPRTASTRVVLTRPPFLGPRISLFNLVLSPPIGLAYLAAAVREAGNHVTVIDPLGEAPTESTPLSGWPLRTHGWSVDRIVAELPGDADVVGVSCMFSQEWPLARRLIEGARARLPRAVIVAGGEHVTAVAGHCLESCPALDIAVRGEGEETLVELLATLRRGGDPTAVAGVTARAGKAIRSAPARPRVRDLDTLPPPAWDLVPIDSYLDLGLRYGVSNERTMPLLATRGCPFQCTFCSSPQMWTTRWQARTPASVADEMARYKDRYGATNFEFYDLTAIVRKDWIQAFCRELLARDLGVSWQLPAGTRSEAIDAETAALLARAGHRNLVYAPETGSERLLKLVNKRVALPRMLDSMHAAVAEGISIKMNMICGFPDERWSDVWQTAKFLARTAWIGVDDVMFAAFIPYPGSALFDRLRAAGRIGVLDDTYYFGLAVTGDARTRVSYCDAIGPRALGLYKIAANLGFYAMSFLFRPLRLFQTVWRLQRGDHRTRFEKRLDSLLGGPRRRAAARPARGAP